MRAALALSERSRGRTAPNPNVGCVIVSEGRVVGRGWTQPGGRPHAEAMALEQAGEGARGATAYVTLEPCAHVSPRGPACSDLLVEAGVARVVVATGDPDSRTNGKGLERLRAAGIETVIGIGADAAQRSMAGFFTRQRYGRPFITLKLAMSLDGAIAMADGRSKWITGEFARRHSHVERSRHEMIVVGRGTLNADQPSLDVRLPGLEDRRPDRLLLTMQDVDVPAGWRTINAPGDVLTDDLRGDHILVEGGADTAASFLSADLVDRLLLYRAPILVGNGRTLGGYGLEDLADAHGRWHRLDTRRLGSDTLDVYERVRSE